RVDTVNGTRINTGSVFRPNARFTDNVGHTNSSPVLCNAIVSMPLQRSIYPFFPLKTVPRHSPIGPGKTKYRPRVACALHIRQAIGAPSGLAFRRPNNSGQRMAAHKTLCTPNLRGASTRWRLDWGG